MNDISNRLTPALALCLPLLATAQPGPADPADAKAPAPKLRYESALADYKPWRDIKPGNWRELNDNLVPVPGKPTGHSGHGAAAGVAPAAKASDPAASGHHGHRLHGGKQ